MSIFVVVVVQIDKLLFIYEGRGFIDERRDLPFVTNYPPAHPPYYISSLS